MKKKVLAALLSAAMVATLLAGCGKKEEAPAEAPAETPAETPADEPADAPAADEKMSFEIVSKGLQHQYWQAVKKGVEQKAAELGVEVNFVGPASESDIKDQVAMFDNALNSNPKAIGLAALDTSSVTEQLQSAKDSGIPVIGFDSGVPNAPEGSVLANCSTNNYAAGEMAAEKVYEAIKDRISGNVRIGVVAQDATSESVVNRGLGFIDKIAELAVADGHTATVVGNDKYITDSKCEKTDGANVVIDVRVPSSVTSELSAADATALMNEADTVAIYGSNEHSANAIITANENLSKCGTGEGQIVAAGFDSGAAQIQAVKDGVLLGAITQAPVAMGEILVQTMYDAVMGNTVSDTDTGCQWYTAENIEDPEIAQNLYE
ncbi:MAG: substrate-binding domain-containing protein [Lachnospiraceae bacterium]|nr:substrate-binding domain-containing protein [Lachnospiraceae bacterium]